MARRPTKKFPLVSAWLCMLAGPTAPSRCNTTAWLARDDRQLATGQRTNLDGNLPPTFGGWWENDHFRLKSKRLQIQPNSMQEPCWASRKSFGPSLHVVPQALHVVQGGDRRFEGLLATGS